jgi:hypothetical protein
MPSILNGLSALGAGVSQFAGTAGLEAQRAGLAQQQAILADQLATNREVNVTQPFQKSQLEASEAGANTRNAATNTTSLATNALTNATSRSNNAATIAGDMARTQAQINAPTDVEKLFRFLKINPDGTPVGGSAAPAPPTTGGAPPLPSDDTTQAAPSASGTALAAPSAMDNPLVRKALGFPASGSPEASRMAIAQDVNSDPAFKYKTAGQKAAEIELRVATAEGKMTDPASREDMAKGIASYQFAPISGYGLVKPGGPETMAKVMEINPDYQESRYPEVNKAMSAFGSGKQGDIIRANNVGVQHLDVIDQAAAALANGNVGALNSLKNAFQTQLGYAAPTTFDGLKQIVGTEIEKAVAGGIGSSADRDRLQAALDRARSPAQLQAMTDGFRSLMIGQLSGLKTQYEEATGFKKGPFAFENKLAPGTMGRLGGSAGGSQAAITAPDPIAMARDAIARGAPADAVAKRLRENGIDPSGLLAPQDLARTPGQD